MTWYAEDMGPDVANPHLPDPHFQLPHPLFVAQKRSGEPNEIAFPEFDFVHWPEERRDILEKSRNTSWHCRVPKLLYRGQQAGYRDHFRPEKLFGTACNSVDIFFSHPAHHIRLIKSVSHVDHVDYRYLLFLPGFYGTAANRLKYYLATGSAVLMHDNDFYEFWYPLLVPYKHYIPLLNLYKHSGFDIPGVLECHSER